MDFKNSKSKTISINLDEITDSWDLYNRNDIVTEITLYRTKTTKLAIGHNFLNHCNILQKVQFVDCNEICAIGHGFLKGCILLNSINLDNLIGAKSIGNEFLYSCLSLKFLNFSTMTQLVHIGDLFLNQCLSLKSIDLSKNVNISKIGFKFIIDCMNLTHINLSSIGNIKQINEEFVCGCDSLTTLILPTFTNVKVIGNEFLTNLDMLESVQLCFPNVCKIGNLFLYGCENLTKVAMTGFSRCGKIEHRFMYNNKNLKTIFVDDSSDKFIELLKFELKPAMLHSKIDVVIDGFYLCKYENDIEKINNNESYCKKLLNFLDVHIDNSCDHASLINKIDEIHNQYNILVSDEIVNSCRNETEMFTGIDLKDLPIKKIVLIENINDTYNGFDIVALRKYLFVCKKDDICVNPFTMNVLCEDDMHKILNVNVNMINYFCSD